MLFISLITLIIAIALPNVKISPILFTRLTSIILIYSAALTLNGLYVQSIGSGIAIYSGLFQVTFLTQSIETFIYLLGALILIPWVSIGIENTSLKLYSSALPRVKEYSLIILFTSLGASLLVSSYDLISMYLSIELQSFAVYILSTIYRDSESATNAGLKYFLLGGLSSCLILLGSGLIYTFTGLTNFDSIYSLLAISTNDNNLSQGFLLGFILIAIGFLFKIAAAPFHNWSPDVYDEVPTIVTTWLTIMPKISIIVLLIELQSGLGLNIDSLSLLFGYTTFNVFKNLLLMCSLLSLIIGTVVGLAQTRIKRLLAYSTISHVGFLLLALAVNTEQSIDSLIFYLIQYSMTNLNTFFILLALGYILKYTILKREEGDIRYISELKGQFYSNPLLSLSLAICLFSMAGIPPLIGFFAKQQVLYAATHTGYYFLSIIAILVSVISASYYLKIVKVLHFDSAPTSTGLDTNKPNVEISNIHSYVIATFTLIILLFMFKPNLLLNSTQLLALSLYNY